MKVLTKAADFANGAMAAARNFENPVITKELRTRMRAGRAHWAMLSYVLLLSLVVFGVYYFTAWIRAVESGGMIDWSQRQVGREMFIFLTWFQMALLALAGPSLTSSSLTMEIQQQTMELLSLTSLSPRNIIVGKAASAALFLWMLLFSSLPLAGMCLVFGGISPIEIIVTYVLLAVWAFLFSSLGVFFSAIVTKTPVASLLTYSVGIGYASSVFIFGMMGLVDPRSGVDTALAMLNPGWAPYGALSVANVFGMPVPHAAASFVINGLIAILLLTAAEAHLKYHRPDKALAVRLLLLGLSIFALPMLFATIREAYAVAMGVGGHMGPARSFAAGTMICIIVIVFVTIPAFSTGIVRRAREAGSLFRYMASGFRLRQIFSQDLAGGPAFVLLWFAVCVAVGLIPFVAAPLGNTIPDYLKLAVSMGAVAICYCSAGILASTVSPTRNLAMAVTFIFMILTQVLYLIPLSNYHYGQRTTSLLYEFAYLWPVLPIQSCMEGYKADWMGFRLLVHPSQHWLAVAACYIVLSALILLTASFCLDR